MTDDTFTEEQFSGKVNFSIWGRLLKHARPYRKHVAALVAISAVFAACDNLFPVITRNLIDSVKARLDGKADEVPLLLYGLQFFGLLVGLCLSIWAFIYINGRIWTGLSHDIRRAGFKRLQELSFSYYDRRPVGWLVARLTSDCDRLARVIAWGGLDLLVGFWIISGAVVLMMIFNWKLALLLTAVVPPLAWVSLFFKKRLLSSQREIRKTNSRITAAYNEGIAGVRTTKSLVREAENQEEFRTVTGEMYLFSVRNAVLAALYVPIVLTFGSLATAMALWAGGHHVLVGAMSIGTLVLFLSYSGHLTWPIAEIARVFGDMQAAQAAAERVLDLLDTEPEIKDSPEVLQAMAARAERPAAPGVAVDGHPERIRDIEFRGVSFAYERLSGSPREPRCERDGPQCQARRGGVSDGDTVTRSNAAVQAVAPQSRGTTCPAPQGGVGPPRRLSPPESPSSARLALRRRASRRGHGVNRIGSTQGKPVLDEFSLTVRAGETIALVGPTGGGKTTIVSLLCRFYEPTGGEVLINGVDYRRRSLHWLQSNLGIVLQTPHLFKGTVRENIRYGNLDATDDQVTAVARLVNAHDFITSLEGGYESEVGEGGNRLSTGQKQLVALARAVLADPQIFVMDEATSSVDTETERLIQRGVERVLKGRTSFVIAHRLSTIRSADRILVIDGGRIVEEGTHHDLIRLKGRYYELYTSQFTQEKEDEVLRDAARDGEGAESGR